MRTGLIIAVLVLFAGDIAGAATPSMPPTASPAPLASPTASSPAAGATATATPAPAGGPAAASAAPVASPTATTSPAPIVSPTAGAKPAPVRTSSAAKPVPRKTAAATNPGAAPGQAKPGRAGRLALLAPADAYFGPFGMSPLSIRSTIGLLGRQYHYRTISNRDLLRKALITEDALRRWRTAYPGDTWLAPTFFHLEQLYQAVQTEEARKHATAILKDVIRNYPDTKQGHLSRSRLAAGFPPLTPETPLVATPPPAPATAAPSDGTPAPGDSPASATPGGSPASAAPSGSPASAAPSGSPAPSASPSPSGSPPSPGSGGSR